MSSEPRIYCSVKPIFVIPARGGSKGIPRKNIADLGGKPLLAYTAEAAIEALRLLPDMKAGNETGSYEDNIHDIRRIILSTDSPEIARAAEETGLVVPFMRPAELSTDTAGSREVILHAMDYADRAGIDYNAVVLLQPTSPFRRAEHILDMLAIYATERPDMMVSVCSASANPYYNCFETDPTTGYLHISKGDGLLTRRQDAPKAWEYNGAVYVINPDSIRQMPLGAFPRRIPYEMSREDSLDIDTPLDLQLARLLISGRAENTDR